MKGLGPLHLASRRFLVCTGAACRGRGARAIAKEARRLAKGTDTAVLTTACLRLCTHAPNMVCYPQGVWFSWVTKPVVAQVMAKEAFLDPSLEALIAFRLDPR